VLAAYRLVPSYFTLAEAAYAGWFGPMGVAAVFYALDGIEMLHKGKLKEGEGVGTTIEDNWLVVTMVVVASTVVHALTSVPVTLLLHKRMDDHDERGDEAKWDREADV
jgi:NhaP-type Na+/H+ or K+/H+ antiporter